LSEKGNAFLRPLKNKGFKEQRVTIMRLDDLGTSTTLESNKSHDRYDIYTLARSYIAQIHIRFVCFLRETRVKTEQLVKFVVFFLFTTARP
jgi:hypothetical protein